jgi:hypothetical protein
VKADAAVSFKQKELLLHPNLDQLEVAGECSLKQDGARMKWKILDGVSGEQVAEGFTECLSGEFRVELALLKGLDCDRSYRVTARLGLGHEGEILISRRCALDAPADEAL